jgi:hypothetical protein
MSRHTVRPLFIAGDSRLKREHDWHPIGEMKCAGCRHPLQFATSIPPGWGSGPDHAAHDVVLCIRCSKPHTMTSSGPAALEAVDDATAGRIRSAQRIIATESRLPS